MTRRRFWLLVHRVNGILLAAFLTVVGITGSLLAWRAQLERLTAPRLFVMPPHPEGAQRMDPLALRHTVAVAYPSATVDSVDLTQSASDPLEFYLTLRPTAADQTADDDIFVDPYSGKLLGSRHYGAIQQGWKNFMPFVYALHEDLALGEAGVKLLGVAALLWTVDCFIGMYLTFPASRRKILPSLAARAPTWPGRWISSWLIRWQSGSYKRLYDLHRAGGLWLWVMLLIFAWTGVAFNLPGVYQPVMRVLGAKKPSQLPVGGSVADRSLAAEPDWQAALAYARSSMKQEASGRRFGLLSERFLSYERADCRWTYRVRSTLDVDRIGNTQLQWSDAHTAGIVFHSPVGNTRADAFTTWIEAIHESQIGGYGMRMLVCLSGLVTGLLSLTGIMIFFRKMKRRRRVESSF